MLQGRRGPQAPSGGESKPGSWSHAGHARPACHRAHTCAGAGAAEACTPRHTHPRTRLPPASGHQVPHFTLRTGACGRAAFPRKNGGRTGSAPTLAVRTRIGQSTARVPHSHDNRQGLWPRIQVKLSHKKSELPKLVPAAIRLDSSETGADSGEFLTSHNKMQSRQEDPSF